MGNLITAYAGGCFDAEKKARAKGGRPAWRAEKVSHLATKYNLGDPTHDKPDNMGDLGKDGLAHEIAGL